MWSGKFLAREGRIGYDIFLRGNMKTPTDNEEENIK